MCWLFPKVCMTSEFAASYLSPTLKLPHRVCSYVGKLYIPFILKGLNSAQFDFNKPNVNRTLTELIFVLF